MINAIIFGAGNIGSNLAKELSNEKVFVKYVVRTSGIFDDAFNKVAEQKDWKSFVDEVDLAFICVPTSGKGEKAFEYELNFLEKGKPVITCEKASVAFCWEVLNKYKKLFLYTASVGGGTKMLQEISKYDPQEIKEIKAVVNGTLNYISDGLVSGRTKDEVVKDVLEKGYAEPGAVTFEEIIKSEMNDVLLKTIIIANHSGIFDRVITKEDIAIFDFDISKRCIVKIDRNNIEIGYIEDAKADWLPDGVNNILLINNEKKAYGPGAGADATVLSMIYDLKILSNSFPFANSSTNLSK